MLDHEQTDDQPEQRGDGPARGHGDESQQEAGDAEELPETVRDLPLPPVRHRGVAESSHQKDDLDDERVGCEIRHPSTPPARCGRRTG